VLVLSCASCAPDRQDAISEAGPGVHPTEAQGQRRSKPPSAADFRFVDVTQRSGVDFVHASGSPQQQFILESMAGGGAFFDYDGDGLLDLFLVNGGAVEEVPEQINRLYRNTSQESGADALFTDVTEEAGVGRSGWGMGCAIGDYDNDGDIDLYATYWGPNILYRNEGSGHFVEVTDQAGVGDGGWGSSATFGDIDADGSLDLFVANYLEFDLQDPPGGGRPCSWKGLDVFCGPMGMESQANVLYSMPRGLVLKIGCQHSTGRLGGRGTRVISSTVPRRCSRLAGRSYWGPLWAKDGAFQALKMISTCSSKSGRLAGSFSRATSSASRSGCQAGTVLNMQPKLSLFVQRSP
jgi:hypothetical protein